MSQRKYTIAVDFDGVLHSYTSPWVDYHVIPDAPVEGAIQWLTRMRPWFKVVIFTTRGRTEAGRAAVAAWLNEHGYPAKETDVTSQKPTALIYIDDRGYRFDGTFPDAQMIHKLKPWNK